MNLKRFDVELAATRLVTARVVVKAENEEHARQIALERAGDSDWRSGPLREDVKVSFIQEL